MARRRRSPSTSPAPGAQVLLQFFLFLRLGRSGYETVQGESQQVAQHLAAEIGGAMPAFELISDGSTIPVFAWRQVAGHTDKWDLYDLSDRLRMHGWQVPAYPMPDDLAEVTVQRIVVRNGLTMDLANELLAVIAAQVAYLDNLTAPLPKRTTSHAFTH